MSTIEENILQWKIQRHQKMILPSSSTIPVVDYSRAGASFAQKRAWINENMYHDPSSSSTINNILLPLVIKSGSLSIQSIRSAVVAILKKNTILRTAIHFDKKHDNLIQEVQPIVDHDNYFFQLTRKKFQDPDDIVILLKNEAINPFAQLDRGLVVRCHLIKIDLNDDDEYLKSNDMILFVFHQIAFDYNSFGPFILAFSEAYNQIQKRVTNLQYIDFTLYEYARLNDGNRMSKMNEARQFWSKQMYGYKHEEQYSLSTISARNINKRSGESYSIAFDLDSHLVEIQSEFASLNNVSMHHMGLACYYIFLYELNNHNINDLCIACQTDNRPLVELQYMIGMFANILPYRIQIEPKHSFIDFLKRIRELCTDIIKYTEPPYQLIMGDTNGLHSPKIPFHFRYDSIDFSPTVETSLELKAKDAILSLYTDRAWMYSNGVTSNDLTLTMIHNPHEQKTHYIFECSTDCYDQSVISKMSQWYQNFLTYLFTKNITTNEFDQTIKSIENLSLQMQTNSLEPSKFFSNRIRLNLVSLECYQTVIYFH